MGASQLLRSIAGASTLIAGSGFALVVPAGSTAFAQTRPAGVASTCPPPTSTSEPLTVWNLVTNTPGESATASTTTVDVVPPGAASNSSHGTYTFREMEEFVKGTNTPAKLLHSKKGVWRDIASTSTDGATASFAVPQTAGPSFVKAVVSGDDYAGASVSGATPPLKTDSGTTTDPTAPGAPLNPVLSVYQTTNNPGYDYYSASWSPPQVCSGSQPLQYQLTFEASPDGMNDWTPFGDTFSQTDLIQDRRFPVGFDSLPFNNYVYARLAISVTTANGVSGPSVISSTVNLAQV